MKRNSQFEKSRIKIPIRHLQSKYIQRKTQQRVHSKMILKFLKI